MEERCPKHSEHEVRIKRSEDDILELDTRSTNIAQHVSGIEQTLIKHDEWISQSNRRIEKTEKLTEAIVEVTSEIRISNINQEKILKAITSNQEDHDARLKIVEQQPAVNALAREKRFRERAFDIVVTATVTGGLGYMIALSKLVR